MKSQVGDNIFDKLEISVELDGGRATAFVVIDTSFSGTSSGGLRIASDICLDEIRVLAREMSFKYSLFGQSRGGAKCGLRVMNESDLENKRKTLFELGCKIKNIIRSGLYYPGLDMNCSYDDLKCLYSGAGLKLSKKTIDTSYCTAISVCHAIKVCANTIQSQTKPLRVGIEGFGSVASHLVSLLPANQFKIVAISTKRGAVLNDDGFPFETLIRLRASYGDDLINHLHGCQVIKLEDLFSADVDILVPAARTWSLNSSNVSSVQARFVVPAANAPYTSEAIDYLNRAGVFCLPGFITNSGGVFASGLFDSGVSLAQIDHIASSAFSSIVRALIQRSTETGLSPVHLAEHVAIKRMKLEAQTNNSPSSMLTLKKLYSKKLIPKKVFGMVSQERFLRNLKVVEELIAAHD